MYYIYKILHGYITSQSATAITNTDQPFNNEWGHSQ